MSIERASELVKLLTNHDKIDLFAHFVDYFNLTTEKQLCTFAEMCGYTRAVNVRIV